MMMIDDHDGFQTELLEHERRMNYSAEERMFVV